MSEIFDERRKALEEDYFRRKERELLDKMRQELAAEAAARGQAGRQCPLGHGALAEEARGSVVIDRCEQCGGIWLDRGELEEVTRQSGGWFDNFIGSFKNESGESR